MVKKDISLQITVQKDMDTSLSKAYPLCILYGNDNFINWYCSKYINAIGSIWKDGSSEFDLIDWCGLQNKYIKGSVNEWFEIDYYPPNQFVTLEGLLEFLKNNLMREKYCVIFVDEFYISISNHYLKKHFMHEYLIYGLSYEKKSALVIAFNRKGHLDKLLIPFFELFSGVINFDEGKRMDLPIINTQIIGLVVKKDLLFPNINIKEICEQIESYVFHEYTAADLALVSITYEGKLFWGIETYQLLYYHIINVSKYNEKEDFRLIHFFYEHKKGIGNKLRVIQNVLSIENIQHQYMKEVIEPIQLIRMHYLKDIVSNKKSFDDKKFRSSLEEIKQSEIYLLKKLYQLLKCYL